LGVFKLKTFKAIVAKKGLELAMELGQEWVGLASPFAAFGMIS
jgi:hypothetical protein